MKYVIASGDGAYLSKCKEGGRGYAEWKYQDGGCFKGAILDPSTLAIFESRAEARRMIKHLKEHYPPIEFEILKCREKKALQVVE